MNIILTYRGRSVSLGTGFGTKRRLSETVIRFQPHQQEGKTGGPGRFGAARSAVWASSPPSYRYVVPRSTETKLTRLRVKATGVRRKRGPAKGRKPVAKLPGGSGTIKALAAVCQSEGLPQPRPLPPGEQRTVKQTGCEEFVARTGQTQVMPRTKRAVTGSSSLLRSNSRGKH